MRIPEMRPPVTPEPTDLDLADDAALFAALRRTWEGVDPAPVGLVDDMVAAVASADLGREYALLTLVEADSTAAVRGDADMLTLQFSDGHTNVLVHVTPREGGAHRLDGWADGEVAEVHLIQQDAETRTTSDGGRFAFDDVEGGVSRLRILLTAAPSPDAGLELLTPRFEI